MYGISAYPCFPEYPLYMSARGNRKHNESVIEERDGEYTYLR